MLIFTTGSLSKPPPTPTPSTFCTPNYRAEHVPIHSKSLCIDGTCACKYNKHPALSRGGGGAETDKIPATFKFKLRSMKC